MKTTRRLVGVLLSATLSVAPSPAQWVQTSDPSLGGVRCLAISGGTLFAGGAGGVSLSTNNGATWQAASLGLGTSAVYALAVSGSTLFAGTYGGGVFRSTDNGASWQSTSTGLSIPYVWALAVNGNDLFAGTFGGGVFLSTDNGTNWQAVNSGLANKYILALAADGTNVFAGCNGGFYVSTNNGTSWASWQEDASLKYITFLSFAVSGMNVFAGSASGVYLSTDHGMTWQASNTGLTDLNIHALATYGGYVFAGTSGGVFVSRDIGASWEAVNSGLTSLVISSLAISGTSIFTAGTFVWKRPLTDFIPPGQPILWSPLNGTVAQGTGVTFIWLAMGQASQYWLRVSRNAGFTDLFYDNSVGLSNNVHIDGFPGDNSTFWWRVWAGNAAGWGNPSIVWNFQNGLASPSVAPTLLAPADGATFYSIDVPTFRWNSVPGATDFDLQFDDAGPLPVDRDTTYVFFANSLSFGSHSWRVRARNLEGAGPWSGSRSFSILPKIRTLTVASANPANAVMVGVNPPDNNSKVGGATPLTLEYNSGTYVELTAPATATGNQFDKWLKNGEGFSNYFINLGWWEGQYWVGNSSQGGWFPDVDSVAHFGLDNTSWGQVRTKAEIQPGETIKFCAQVFLNSNNGASNIARISFGDGWSLFQGQSFGVKFDGGRILVYKMTPSEANVDTLGTYVPGEIVTFSLTRNADGSITVSAKGVFRTYVNPANIPTFHAIIAVSDANPDMFLVRSVDLRSSIASTVSANVQVDADMTITATYTPVGNLFPAPVLIYPITGASNQPITGLVFRWSRPQGASTFSFQLASDPTFASGLVKNDTALVDTFRTVNGLGISTAYYWRVRGSFGGVAGPWSLPFGFSTLTPLPGQVALVSPAHNQVFSTNNVQFVWHKSSPPGDRYELDLCLDSMFTGFMNIDSTITDTVRFYSSLPMNQRWFWRVRAHNPGGWGPYSEGRAFTLSSTPTVRTLTVASSNPSSGVAIGVAPADQNGVSNGTTQFTRQYNSGTTVTLMAPPTASGNAFQKWLRAGNDFATTATVNVLMDIDLTLTAVYTTTLPGQVTLMSPAHNQVLSTNNVQFVWHKSSPPGDRYELDLCLDSAFAGFMSIDSTITDTTRFYSNLPIDQRWFWRVRAHIPGGWGPYSEVWAFTLSSAPTVRTLTVTSSNPASGVSIGVAPSDRNNQADGSTQFTRLYNSGTSVTLTAPSTAGGNQFEKWLKTGSPYATTATINVLVDGDYTLTAVYVPVSAISVTAPSAGASWTAGTQLQVTWSSQNVTGNVSVLLSTDGGSTFGASLATAPVSAGTATVTVPNMPSLACRVKVVSVSDTSVWGLSPGDFSIVPVIWTLTINSENPSSGVIIAVSPSDNNGQANGVTPFSRKYNAGSLVTLTAPSSAGSNVFRKWLKGSSDSVLTDDVSVLMDADYTLTAVYVTPPPPPPPPPTALTASNITVSGFTANWSSVAGAAEYRLDVATDNGFGSILTGYNNLNVGPATGYPVGGLAPSTTYCYRVRALNSGGGASSNSDTISVTTLRAYPVSYPLAVTKQFPVHGALVDYSSDDYQLVGLPGASGELISAFLPGSQRSDWQVYWDNGVVSDKPETYYVEYDGSSTFVCSAGRAYWLLNRGAWNLSAHSVPTASLSPSREVKIALTPGQKWNLITNPFDRSVPWSAVTTLNGIGDSIREWISTGWAYAGSFKPYAGYLFFNSAGKDSLRIPYDAVVPKAAAVADAAGWTVQVLVRGGVYIDQTTFFGIREDAAFGLDLYEQRKPRHLERIADVYFGHPEWDSQYSEFATDIRPPISGEDGPQVWSLTLRADAKRTRVEVQFMGIADVPGNLAVYLLDEAGGRSVDLRKEARYGLTPATALRKLQVLIGKEELVKEKVDAALPREFALLPNYPNPFNPATTIPVVVPVKGQISVVIYNILGQQVRQLIDGILEPGIHYLQWQGMDEAGRSVSSGIYYCRMQGPTGAQTSRSLVLVR